MAMTTYRELLEHAFRATKYSYAPYSRFRVGAAILTEEGEVITGCNVENASYGLSNCAERTAVFKAVSMGKTKFKAIAVVSNRVNPVYPCGACRQVLREFNKNITIIMADQNKNPLKTNLSKLLPNSFGPEDLRKP